MYRPNFCAECGERLARRNWRAWIKVWTGTWARAWWCEDCARRLGRLGFTGFVRSVAFVALLAISAFSFGRFLRPAQPPLIISRAANSPLSDLPVNFDPAARTVGKESDSTDRNGALSQAADEKAYICGARTKKGTPCRRRVHGAGQRCFQHRGAVAMVPLDKLEVKSK